MKKKQNVSYNLIGMCSKFAIVHFERTFFVATIIILFISNYV